MTTTTMLLGLLGLGGAGIVAYLVLKPNDTDTAAADKQAALAQAQILAQSQKQLSDALLQSKAQESPSIWGSLFQGLGEGLGNGSWLPDFGSGYSSGGGYSADGY